MKSEILISKLSFIICLVVPLNLGQQPATNSSNGADCTNLQTCGECIQLPSCAWCKEEINTDNTDIQQSGRCDTRENLLKKRNCPEKDVVDPDNSRGTIRNEKLSEHGTELNRVVQIAPQEVTLKLRPGRPYNLDVTYREAPDYPVDLYVLMDLSQSMKDDKQNLGKLGGILAERLERITKNYTLGFGSFVDKTVMPYVSTVPEKLKQPCDQCARPYGFINHLPLKMNSIKEFTDQVINTAVSGNLDAPEGGLDAVMQAVVCDKEIGWRQVSRKLIVVATDDGFHYAGDGKLGGIVKPNDGLCHLDNNGSYTHSTVMDYPSLSQLRKKLKEKTVSLIFAVTERQVEIYKKLSDFLEVASTGQLDADSRNIVDLIQQQYNAITSAVTLNDNADEKYIATTYYSQCLDGKKLERKTCKGLSVGDTVSFTVQIGLNVCPNDTKLWKQKFTISPAGLSEKLTVNLEMLCECDCEKPGAGVPNSPKCNSMGSYQCGTCKCPENRHGRFCQCSNSQSGDGSDPLCIRPNSTLVCSNKGICNCGVCQCDKQNIYGQWCHCSDNSCDRYNGVMCNGKGHCKCNKCICNSGWERSACECEVGNDKCIAPNSNEVCSGRGTCECGKCKCTTEDKTTWLGIYCNECAGCDGQCTNYRDCVQCKMFKSGELSKEECDTKCPVTPVEVDVVEKENDDERLCTYKVDGCNAMFVYGYDKNDLYVRAESKARCPSAVAAWMIATGVIGGILAIGIVLLLIWKLVTTVHDKREFAKFENERKNPQWPKSENPLFVSPTTNFENPTFNAAS